MDFLHAILSFLVIGKVIEVVCLQVEYFSAKVLASQKERQDNIQGWNRGNLALTVTSFFCISIISACILKKKMNDQYYEGIEEQSLRCKNKLEVHFLERSITTPTCSVHWFI